MDDEPLIMSFTKLTTSMVLKQHFLQCSDNYCEEHNSLDSVPLPCPAFFLSFFFVYLFLFASVHG